MITLQKRSKNGLVFRFEEKHGNRFFYCKTQEDINNMFLKLVRARHEENYWYIFDTVDEAQLEKQINVLTLCLEDFTGIPRINDAFKKEIESLKNQIHWSKESRQMEKWLRMAIDKGNAKAANYLCSERMDYQYEGFEYDDAEEIG